MCQKEKTHGVGRGSQREFVNSDPEPEVGLMD